MMQILWGVWLRTYKFIWNSTPIVLSEVTSSEQSDMWMGQTVHSLVGTAPALGHLIDCLHNVLFLETDVLFLETDLTDLILCLSNTRNMMGPSELDLSETSVSVLKMYTAWLSPKKAGSCSSVTDVCPLLEDSIHDVRAGPFSEAPCNFNQAAPNPFSFLSTKGVWVFWALGLSLLLWHIVAFSPCSVIQKRSFLLRIQTVTKSAIIFYLCCTKLKIPETSVSHMGRKEKKDLRRCRCCNLTLFLPTTPFLWNISILKSDQLNQ